MASLSGVQARFENETFISGPEKKKSSKLRCPLMTKILRNCLAAKKYCSRHLFLERGKNYGGMSSLKHKCLDLVRKREKKAFMVIWIIYSFLCIAGGLTA